MLEKEIFAMNIGDISQQTDLPTKTIRYYEEIGLVTPHRGANGYRSFTQTDLHNLNFVARARSLGFTIEDCRALLGLYKDEERASSDVKHIAREHLDQIETKIDDLRAIQKTLQHLIHECAGDQRPDCPILKNLGKS